jgi:hypothetical protein
MIKISADNECITKSYIGDHRGNPKSSQSFILRRFAFFKISEYNDPVSSPLHQQPILPLKPDNRMQ